MWRMVRLQGRISNVGELHGGSCWTNLWLFRRQQLVALNQCKFIRAKPSLPNIKIVLSLLITKKSIETWTASKFEEALPSPVVYCLGWSICHPSKSHCEFFEGFIVLWTSNSDLLWMWRSTFKCPSYVQCIWSHLRLSQYYVHDAGGDYLWAYGGESSIQGFE